MWWNEEMLSRMFVESVHNQRQELLRARQRNSDLKKKCEDLEKEKGTLHHKLNINQVQIVNGKNELNSLQEQIRAQRRLNMELTQRLRVYQEQIDMVNSSIEETNGLNHSSLIELEPIKENLDFKSNVVDCLEKKLIESRLNSAEQEQIVSELYKIQNSLEIDIDALKGIKPGTASKWQQEFLDAKIKEADVLLEFRKLKRTITTLKDEVRDKILESEKDLDESSGDFFSLKFNIKDKYLDELKQQVEMTLANTVDLQDEVDHLKIEIHNLEDISKDIRNQICLNEENKVHLHSVRTSLYYRLTKILQELEAETEKYKNLEEASNKELDKILKSITDKTFEIAKLNERITEIEAKMEGNGEEAQKTEDEMIEETAKSLCERIEFLENKIDELSS